LHSDADKGTSVVDGVIIFSVRVGLGVVVDCVGDSLNRRERKRFFPLLTSFDGVGLVPITSRCLRDFKSSLNGAIRLLRDLMLLSWE
jgi:hypothetical protein